MGHLVGLVYAGGFGSLISKINATNPKALLLSAGENGAALYLGLILGSLAIGLGYPGQPHILSRYMGLRTEREVKKGAIIAMSWTTFAVAGAILLGFFAIPYLRGVVTDPEHVTLSFAAKILPP